MSAGVWLLVVGVCDLLRAARDTTSVGRRVLLVLAGLAALLFVAVSSRFPPAWWGTVGACWLLGLAAWVLTSSLALDPSSSHRHRWRAGAFCCFAAPLGLLVLVGARPLPSSALWSWLADRTLVGSVGGAVFVTHLGVALALLSTSNVLVRLVLDAVGVPAVANERQLRGGRLLGPMERLFLLGLAAMGQVAAGGVVVAAKGLLRYPELQRSGRDQGATDVSEYFLIGSFASWLLALGGWTLVRILG
jgi:hypothetical protein